MMDMVSPITDILTRLCDCVGNGLDNIWWGFEANVKALENALDQLKNISEDVKRRVTLEEEKHMVRKKLVDVWLRNVEDKEITVNDVLQKANQEARQRSCCGCPINCWSSYKISKEVRQNLKIVNELKDRGSFDTVADMMPRGRVDERPLEQTVGLDSAFDEVQGWIEDENVKVIGIYGMGGAGKTTLLKKINNEFVNTSHGFDLVIWVVVSQQFTVEKVQNAICEKLKLPESTWKDKSEDEKAVQIFRILDTKKFVLLLDDIWKRLDLVKVGVPPPDDPRTCKVIFTTRFEDMCGLMEAHKKIKIQGLSKEEALTLLKKKVGVNTLNAHPIIPKLAEDVAEACKGLPLCLITVGRAMAGKQDPRDWDRAVTKLRRDPTGVQGMEEDVYHILKFSYDSLPDDAIKSCFTYCCIYPEDHQIKLTETLDLWIGEGFFDEFDDTHEAREVGREIVGRLKAACLLESGEMEEFVRMHDVIREMALWISSGSTAMKKKYLVLDHPGRLEVPQVDSWRTAERISLWGSTIRSIIDIIPPCPNVITFIARGDAIPCGFLQLIYNVKVLDLSSNMRLEKLPSGIDKLVELQFLNLSRTFIRELPMEMKNLEKMRYLMLEDMLRLQMIPRGVISSFSLLRVFRIMNVLDVGGGHLLEELELLQHINDITITLFDATSIHKLQGSYKIQNCLSVLGFQYCRGLTSLELSSSSVKTMRHLETLSLYDCALERLIIVPDSTTMDYGCFRNLRNVGVSSCHNLQDLTWIIYAPMLEILRVHSCKSMTEIVKDPPSHAARSQADQEAFTRLKRMILHNLPNLHSIYPRPLPFPSLVEINVFECESLRRLPFDSGSAEKTLEEIRGGRAWWGMLQWDDESLERKFSSFFKSYT